MADVLRRGGLYLTRSSTCDPDNGFNRNDAALLTEHR